MKESRDPSGRMPYRLFYEEAEIDQIMEDELRRFGYQGSGPVDVDRLVEAHLRITPEYVSLPAGVQGATEFFPDGAVHMRISADVAERASCESGAEHLLRTTTAHEAAHVLLQRQLFLSQSEEMFGGASSRRELCRDIGYSANRYTGEWWEWQANRGMAGLLMPKGSMVKFVRHLRMTAETEPTSEVAREFNVSAEAAGYRLQQLHMVAPPGQSALNV